MYLHVVILKHNMLQLQVICDYIHRHLSFLQGVLLSPLTALMLSLDVFAHVFDGLTASKLVSSALIDQCDHQ